MTQMNLFAKQKETHIENKLIVAREERGGINWELMINRYKLLYIKQMNKDLLYYTENYIQYLLITYDIMEKKLKKKIYMCV